MAGYLGLMPGNRRTYVTFDPDGSDGDSGATALVELLGTAPVPADVLLGF